MPKEAAVVSGYVRYLVPYVVEFNQPQEQTRKLKQICEKFKKQGSLESGEAFESYAMLYHILMDLEEFLVYKMRFIRDLDEEQKGSTGIKCCRYFLLEMGLLYLK